MARVVMALDAGLLAKIVILPLFFQILKLLVTVLVFLLLISTCLLVLLEIHVLYCATFLSTLDFGSNALCFF